MNPELNPRDRAYKWYGSRGIKFSWKTFEEFRDDMYESYLKHCEEFGEKNTCIERINNMGPYSMKNCRWATRIEQANNRRNNYRMYIPEGMYTIADLARKFGMKPNSFYVTVSRIRKT